MAVLMLTSVTGTLASSMFFRHKTALCQWWCSLEHALKAMELLSILVKAIEFRTPRLCSQRLAWERLLMAALEPITSRRSRLASMSSRRCRTR